MQNQVHARCQCNHGQSHDRLRTQAGSNYLQCYLETLPIVWIQRAFISWRASISTHQSQGSQRRPREIERGSMPDHDAASDNICPCRHNRRPSEERMFKDLEKGSISLSAGYAQTNPVGHLVRNDCKVHDLHVSPLSPCHDTSVTRPVCSIAATAPPSYSARDATCAASKVCGWAISQASLSRCWPPPDSSSPGCGNR